MARRITPRGKTVKFRLNEKFIFGAARCIRCGRVLKVSEYLICSICKLRMRRNLD